MANPQKNNGYTAIANEILEALISSGLNGTEIAVTLHILRKTYGFQKREDEISLSQFEKSLPFTRPSICKALKMLQLVKVIKLVKIGKSKVSANTYQFNKDFETWQLVKKSKLVKNKHSTSKDLEIQLVNKPLHTKETLTKENTKGKGEATTPRLGLCESFGEMGEIKLKPEEYRKLCQQIGGRNVKRYIQSMEDWKLCKKGNRYDDDYRAMLNWIRRDKASGKLKIEWSHFDSDDFDTPEDYEKIINKYA